MYDTVIIGAGLSGLAAGIRLAYYQKPVCIVERHSTIGGLNSFYRLEGRNHDVGLHAVTNYPKRRGEKGPLSKALRQLRLAWDTFSLSPQNGSLIAFPGVTLAFNNDLALLESEIARNFPDQIDRFRRLVQNIADYSELDLSKADASAREFIGSYLTDPGLIDMILCPLMYYGNARQHDMDFAQFCILFRSVYMEGLGRPYGGIRLILKNLVRKYKELGGELRLHCGVSRLRVNRDQVTEVVLDDGAELQARRVLSSAGWLETMRMCEAAPPAEPAEPGEISLVETISVLDMQPKELGFDKTTVFFNDSERFHWEKPETLVDCRSGVICSPNNFSYEKPLPEGLMRVTCLANFDDWSRLPSEQYQLEKLRWYDRICEAAVRFIPEFRHRVVATDTFTPTTIRRFTGHVNGALYGSPRKRYDGRTHLENLYLCGTDQGFVGIVGAIIGGLTMANRLIQSDLR